jgi:hypothetical protein
VTFSKIHGLAGLRVGYLIADPGIVTTLRKIRAPFSVGTLAQAGALAALGDPGHAAQVRARTLQRGDGFQLRLVLERGNPPSPRQLQITHHASPCRNHNVRANAPVTRFRVLADSEPSPSQ